MPYQDFYVKRSANAAGEELAGDISGKERYKTKQQELDIGRGSK